ncbi:MAG TPA: hypothetical protein VEB67_03025 [Nitrososphaerales archaeon]|nr:hypothetical protein [Nitrososphaerales archaeon]
MTVTLNPNSKTAKVTMDSSTNILLTYPNGSQLSNFLKNVNSSINLSGNFAHATDGVQVLQSSFHQDDDQGSQASIQNVTVAYSYNAKGNATAFVMSKSTNITAWVTGVFSVVNGSVTADLHWRSFVVRNPLIFTLADHTQDVNFVGPTAQASLAEHAVAAQFVLNMFGASYVWDRPTLNYSALSSPLSTWTKNYDSGTNTTTFSKTISGSSTFTSSADINGQKYTMSATSDPSAVLAVSGYASAQSDSISVGAAPASATAAAPMTAAVVIGGVAIVLIAGVAYLALRARSRAKPIAVPTPSPAIS